jgi:hypothetical protein
MSAMDELTEGRRFNGEYLDGSGEDLARRGLGLDNKEDSSDRGEDIDNNDDELDGELEVDLLHHSRENGGELSSVGRVTEQRKKNAQMAEVRRSEQRRCTVLERAHRRRR